MLSVSLVATPAAEAPAQPAAERAAVDSVVLERTSGFSNRPAYRVSVARSGAVRFARQQGYRDPPGPRTGAATVSPAAFRRLVARVDASGLATMPAEVTFGDSALCPRGRTDAASAVIAVYRGPAVQRVDVYLGCWASDGGDYVPRVQRLVTLAEQIDATASTRRWLRAAYRDS